MLSGFMIPAARVAVGEGVIGVVVSVGGKGVFVGDINVAVGEGNSMVCEGSGGGIVAVGERDPHARRMVVATVKMTIV